MPSYLSGYMFCHTVIRNTKNDYDTHQWLIDWLISLCIPLYRQYFSFICGSGLLIKKMVQIYTNILPWNESKLNHLVQSFFFPHDYPCHKIIIRTFERFGIKIIVQTGWLEGGCEGEKTSDLFFHGPILVFDHANCSKFLLWSNFSEKLHYIKGKFTRARVFQVLNDYSGFVI